jgi:hypothetical protein
LGIAYRFRQFWTAWTAAPSADDFEKAYKILSPEMMKLFQQMHPSEQIHSLAIFNELKKSGENSSDLLAAALLHDVGKSLYPLNPWERSIVVIIRKLAPNLFDRWSQSEPRGWKKPFVVYACHAQWGADLVERAGGNQLVVNLIKRHQDPLNGNKQTALNINSCQEELEDYYLIRLQKLDNES